MSGIGVHPWATLTPTMRAPAQNEGVSAQGRDLDPSTTSPPRFPRECW